MGKKRVLIFGSCVSRDIFDYDIRAEFEIVRYYARSSFASLATKPFVEEDVLEKIPSAFQRRCARWDMDKSFWQYLKEASFDILLLDLIDDRFNLYRHSKQSVSTISVGYKEAKLNLQMQNIIFARSKEYTELWRKGLQFFTKETRKFQEKIVINENYWISKLRGGA